MSIKYIVRTDVAIDRRHGIHRRDFLRGIAASSVAAGMLGWTDLLCAESSQPAQARQSLHPAVDAGRARASSKPSARYPGHANGGETKAIATAVPGIQIAENFPEVAKMMGDVAIIRSMTGKEGAHPRATFLMHTGYLPTASVKYPAFGSVVAEQVARSRARPAGLRADRRQRQRSKHQRQRRLPGVRIRPVHDGGRRQNAEQHDPPATDFARFGRRLDLLRAARSGLRRRASSRKRWPIMKSCIARRSA